MWTTTYTGELENQPSIGCDIRANVYLNFCFFQDRLIGLRLLM